MSKIDIKEIARALFCAVKYNFDDDFVVKFFEEKIKDLNNGLMIASSHWEDKDSLDAVNVLITSFITMLIGTYGMSPRRGWVLDENREKAKQLADELSLLLEEFKLYLKEVEAEVDTKELFLTDLFKLYDKYNISISHEDCHGSFILERGDKYMDENKDWMRYCDVR